MQGNIRSSLIFAPFVLIITGRNPMSQIISLLTQNLHERSRLPVWYGECNPVNSNASKDEKCSWLCYACITVQQVHCESWGNIQCSLVFFIPQTALDPPRLRVLVVGLDQSGKTAFVECLEKGKKEILKSEPTDCFSMKFVTIGDIMFDIWDGKKESLFQSKYIIH